MDYKAFRQKMITEQLLPRGIKNQRVLDVFLKVERHKFIPRDLSPIEAYADSPLQIGHTQTISQPYIVALMTQSLNLSGEEKVLEIGTGSGYQTAILAELANKVFSIERINDLAKNAENTLNSLGYQNITIKSGDGSLGWTEASPFDRIIITAATPKVPPVLLDQLAENGLMILPLGEPLSQVLTLVEKKDGRLSLTELCRCVFVPLVTKFGHPYS